MNWQGITTGLSLGKRLTLSFTVVIAFMALLAALSVYRIGRLNNNAVLRIWLGDTPVQNDLKRGLLGEK